MPNAKHVQDIEWKRWKGEEKYIRMTQDARTDERTFPEKMVKICSIAAELLLFSCLTTNLFPCAMTKIALPTDPTILFLKAIVRQKDHKRTV